jgi:hypothetical protein
MEVIVDNVILKKKLNTFKSEKGTLRDVSDEVVFEVLRTWENWPGKSSDLYPELGLSKMQMVTMIQKAKKMVKSGMAPPDDFKELKIEGSPSNITSLHGGPCLGVEIIWDGGKLIRFQQVEQLIDFLKKVA